MQQINVNVLKPHPNNSEYFDDLVGEEYERLKESIQKNRIYTPILVSPDMTIISGHQRARAAKELGMSLVPVEIAEDLDSEDEKLKALISCNFGRHKNDAEKNRKAIAKYVELVGYEHKNVTSQIGKSKQIDIAAELGISKTELNRILAIERKLSEPMKKLLDDGVIGKTVAADVIASLSEEEQRELFESLDISKDKISRSEIDGYIERLRKADRRIEELENRQPEVRTEIKEVIKEVVPDDYEELKRKAKMSDAHKSDFQYMQGRYQEMAEKWKKAEHEKDALIAEMNKPEEKKKHELRLSAFHFCTGVASFLEEYGGYAYLMQEIDSLEEKERERIQNAVRSIRDWAEIMSNEIVSTISEIY